MIALLEAISMTRTKLLAPRGLFDDPLQGHQALASQLDFVSRHPDLVALGRRVLVELDAELVLLDLPFSNSLVPSSRSSRFRIAHKARASAPHRSAPCRSRGFGQRRAFGASLPRGRPKPPRQLQPLPLSRYCSGFSCCSLLVRGRSN